MGLPNACRRCRRHTRQRQSCTGDPARDGCAASGRTCVRGAHHEKTAVVRSHDCGDARIGYRRQQHGVHHRQRRGPSPAAVRERRSDRSAQRAECRQRAEPGIGALALDFQEWQTARRTFEHIVATEERPWTSRTSNGHRPWCAAYVSWNTFKLIGHPPALGRDFTAADDRTGASPAVILGGTIWRARFGADPAIVGKTIRANGVPSTVIGVMPPEVGFPDRVEFWLPLVSLPEAERTSRSTHILDGFGRLRPASPSSRRRRSSMASRPRSPSATRTLIGTPRPS